MKTITLSIAYLFVMFGLAIICPNPATSENIIQIGLRLFAIYFVVIMPLRYFVSR